VLSRRGLQTDRADVEVTADLSALLRSLRGKDGTHILCIGGADLAKQLLEMGALDELRLFLHPIILGHGLSLFDGLKPDIKLRLTGTRVFETGLVELHYRVESSREPQ
jgi:dihydrofolate reductase